MKIGDKISLIVIGVAVVGFIIWEQNYQSNTLKRIDTIEEKADTAMKGFQKVTCQNMYGAEKCEDDYLIVPDKKDVHIDWSHLNKKISDIQKDVKIIKKKVLNVKTTGKCDWKCEAQNEVVEIIKSHEDFREKGYRDGCKIHLTRGRKCPANQLRYSIGYGTMEKTRGETISKTEASRRMKDHLSLHVFPYIPNNVTDKGTYIALADIGYNAGIAAMRASIKNGGTLCMETYQKYTVYQGKKNAGLERRRTSTLIYSLSKMEY